jgi:small GTP-binding protein
MNILSTKHETILKEERKLLSDLRMTLAEFGASAEDQNALAESIQQVDDFFLLVIVGEFNAGKSAFINALLGDDILKEGVTPTTTQVNILRYGERKKREIVDEQLHVLTAPVDLLTEISIVDTPGTNAVIREHEAITLNFVPRSDFVLFITSADRPFTESERTFLERIHDWGKKVVVVINKIDILQNEDEIAQVEAFLADKVSALLGVKPEIFPISARMALQAKQGQPALWQESRFEALETYIHDMLDEAERLRLKFLNPLGVGKHLAQEYIQETQSRLALLEDDFSMLEDVERQLQLYRQDMIEAFNFRMADIDNVLHEMEQRGEVYFDETMRLARVFDLLNKDKIQEGFEEQVIANTPEKIEKKVHQLIDWMVAADLKQWQAVTEYIADRQQEHKDRIVGVGGMSNFHYDRERLIEGIGRESKRVVETYDKTAEARKIAQGAQSAVAASAVLEAGAVGLGALVTAIATTLAVDITGILLAGLVAVLGFFVIPAKRRQVKQEMRAKIKTMRTQLTRALRTHFESEIEQSIAHINDTIAPYSRFVRAEGQKNKTSLERLRELQAELNRLEARIKALSSSAS